MLNILLTNDDGIDAPGLLALRQSVELTMRRFRPDQPFRTVAVAPDRCRSECGHSIETSRPLTLKTVADDWHCVDGTPVDCIRVAIYALNFQPHVVFSGINAGANLGVNLMVSGTFAAAREASVLGLPAMAASHYRRPDVPKTWDHTPEWLAETMAEFLDRAVGGDANVRNGPLNSSTQNGSTQDGSTQCNPPLWNVNLPAVPPQDNSIPPRVRCDVDRRPLDRVGLLADDGQVRFELDYHARPREPGTDVDVCFSGQITISELNPHHS